MLLGFALFLVAWAIRSSGTSFTNNVEVDISWDFDGSDKGIILSEYTALVSLCQLGGWADATAEEMQMDVHVEGGELRGSIRGFSPHLDSPLMYLQTTRRHYVVIRMMYFGGADKAQLLLKYAPAVSDRELKDYSKSSWNNKVLHLI